MASQLTTSSEKYHYRPLETQSTIRLLKILPHRVNEKRACTLEHFHREELPAEGYSALSYCWGEPEQNECVYIGNAHGDQTMHNQGVHQNLWEFLEQMFETGNHQEYFWTDFLCLNQDPQDPQDPEIPEQVRRMGDIYSDATRTISWLGRRSDSTEKDPLQDVAASIKWISKTWMPSKERPQGPIEFFRLSSRSWHDLKSGSVGARNGGPSVRPQFIDLGVHSNVWLQTHMQNILRLPYWQRIWIIQEVALAKHVDFMYGKEIIGFEQFFMAYKSHFYCQWYFSGKPGTLSDLKPAIEARDSLSGGSLPIWEILEWGRRCKSSEPVDRLYGLLGILRSGADAAHLGGDLKVDYDKDLSEIYWDFAFHYRLSRSLLPAHMTTWSEGGQDDPERQLYLKRYNECGWIPELGREFVLCWMFLTSLRKALSCAGSFEALEKMAESANVPQKQRDMALVAIKLVSACRAMGNLRESNFRLIGPEQKPWSNIKGTFENVLLWVFLQSDKTNLPPEPEKIQAAAMGRLFELEHRNEIQYGLGRWECGADQNVSSWPGNGQSIMRFKFLDGNMAQCCLHGLEQGQANQRKCKGLPLFLDLPEIGFVLKFDFEAAEGDPDAKLAVVSIAAGNL